MAELQTALHIHQVSGGELKELLYVSTGLSWRAEKAALHSIHPHGFWW